NRALPPACALPTEAPGPVPAAPLAHCGFDEPGGTTTADLSGNGNTGTLAGGPAFAPGKAGNGLGFDGVDDTVRVGRNPGLEPASVSLSAWVFVPAGASEGPYATVVKKAYDDDNSSPWGSYSLRLSPNGLTNRVVFSTGHATGTAPLVSPAAVPTGRWVHLAGTFDSATGRKTIYLDGVPVVSAIATRGDIVYDRTPSGDLYVGKDPGVGEAFKGIIDGAGVWGRVLSAGEVVSLAAGAAPAPPDLAP